MPHLHFLSIKPSLKTLTAETLAMFNSETSSLSKVGSYHWLPHVFVMAVCWFSMGPFQEHDELMSWWERLLYLLFSHWEDTILVDQSIALVNLQRVGRTSLAARRVENPSMLEYKPESLVLHPSCAGHLVCCQYLLWYRVRVGVQVTQYTSQAANEIINNNVWWLFWMFQCSMPPNSKLCAFDVASGQRALFYRRSDSVVEIRSFEAIGCATLSFSGWTVWQTRDGWYSA